MALPGITKRRVFYKNKIKASAMLYMPIDALAQIGEEASEMGMSQGCYVARLMYATGGLIALEKSYKAVIEAREAIQRGETPENDVLIGPQLPRGMYGALKSKQPK